MSTKQLPSEIHADASLKELEIGDLQIGDFEVLSLSQEDSFGVPEMGASQATYGSSTCCNSC